MGSNCFPIFQRVRCLRLIQVSHYSTEHKSDLIGPPNPLTNLRPIKFAIQENETELEKLWRERRVELQLWNEKFWSEHNKSFVKEKEDFIKNQLKYKKDCKESVSPDEMSIFYKNFLDKTWKVHVSYNAEWHKRNFYVTFLDFLVRLQRLFNKFR